MSEGRSVVLKCRITCPGCGHVAGETMPTDICQYFYDCTGCGRLLRPRIGECCVYCSHGDVPCPPVQVERLRAGTPRHGFKIEMRRPPE